MSVRVMSAVWEADLPPMEKLVLLALADCANDEGHCWPAASTLARKSGQGERTVRRAVQSLISKGHLSQRQRAGTSAVYAVHPCRSGTPAKSAPLPDRPPTPATQAPKPLGTVNSSEAKASKQRAKFPAPSGVGDDQWKAFQAQRKKPLNDHSYKLLTKKLDGLADDGFPPGEMIDLAIERGWETVFKPYQPRDQQHGRAAQSNSNPRSRLLDALNAADAELARSAVNEDHAGTWLALPSARTG